MKKKILFLGYDKNQTSLISFLRKRKYLVTENKQKIIKYNKIKNYNLIISFGYNKIVKQNVLNKLHRPIINLHISYLPFNRGSHPNFWSFINNTPKGVTIHEINEGIDTGNIIYQKKINFDNLENLTFNNTYNKLIVEIEKLFIKNHLKIYNNSYRSRAQKEKKKSYKQSDLPINIKSWKIKIKDYLKL